MPHEDQGELHIAASNFLGRELAVIGEPQGDANAQQGDRPASIARTRQHEFAGIPGCLDLVIDQPLDLNALFADPDTTLTGSNIRQPDWPL